MRGSWAFENMLLKIPADSIPCDKFVGVIRPLLLLLRAIRMTSTSLADLFNELHAAAEFACISKVGLPEHVAFENFEVDVKGRRKGSPLSSLAITEARLPFIM